MCVRPWRCSWWGWPGRKRRRLTLKQRKPVTVEGVLKYDAAGFGITR